MVRMAHERRAVAHQTPDDSAVATPVRTPTSTSTAASVAVAATGLALVALYSIATSRLFLLEFFPGTGSAVGWTDMLGPSRRAPAIAYLQLTLGASLLYAIVLVLAWRWRDRVPHSLFFAFPVLFAGALVLMYPPNAASDLFHYHADARTAWIFGHNPFVVPPGDTNYPLLFSWNTQPTPYGPVWTLLTGIFVPLMRPTEHLLAVLIGFKVLAAASLLGCGWLIYRIVATTFPGWQVFAFVLFAWNPYVLLRVVGNGHNDLVMMFFVLLALLAAQRRAWTALFVLLSVSVLIKFIPAILGPPFLIYAWTSLEGRPLDRARALAPGLALGAALPVLAYAPFWVGMATFDGVLLQTGLMITSTPDVLRSLLSGEVQGTTDANLARRLTATIVLLVAAASTWHARRGFDSLVVACFHLMFFYLLFASGWFRPWYMLWPATLIALYPTRAGIALFLAITVSNLFPDLVEHYRYDWGFEPFEALIAPVIVQFAVPAAVWVLAVLGTGSLVLGAEHREGRADEERP